MKQKKRIYNTGKRLPRATIGDQFEFYGKRKTLIDKPILSQSRKYGTVIYGCQAVNLQVGPHLSRDTYDWDVKSRTPLRHLRMIERRADRGVNADLFYIEETSYPGHGGKKPLFRLKSRLNEVVEADYSYPERGMNTTRVKGVRVQSLGDAKGKYRRMLRCPELGRGFNANIDIGRIESYQFDKRFGRRYKKL